MSQCHNVISKLIEISESQLYCRTICSTTLTSFLNQTMSYEYGMVCAPGGTYTQHHCSRQRVVGAVSQLTAKVSS